MFAQISNSVQTKLAFGRTVSAPKLDVFEWYIKAHTPMALICDKVFAFGEGCTGGGACDPQAHFHKNQPRSFADERKHIRFFYTMRSVQSLEQSSKSVQTSFDSLNYYCLKFFEGLESFLSRKFPKTHPRVLQSQSTKAQSGKWSEI